MVWARQDTSSAEADIWKEVLKSTSLPVVWQELDCRDDEVALNLKKSPVAEYILLFAASALLLVELAQYAVKAAQSGEDAGLSLLGLGLIAELPTHLARHI